MPHKNIENAASARFPNGELCRVGFIAGDEWQREQDAARGPRSVSGVGDATVQDHRANQFSYALLRSVNLPPHEDHVRAIKKVICDFTQGEAPSFRLSRQETMEEAKGEVLPDRAGGIRVEWIKGQPCFIGFGDAHAINTLVASIRDQKMDVAKAALNSDCVTDGGVMRLLSSIENRLMELAGGPGIGRIAGWMERIDKDIYHFTTRQEGILYVPD